jgi:hypothetical protein
MKCEKWEEGMRRKWGEGRKEGNDKKEKDREGGVGEERNYIGGLHISLRSLWHCEQSKGKRTQVQSGEFVVGSSSSSVNTIHEKPPVQFKKKCGK